MASRRRKLIWARQTSSHAMTAAADAEWTDALGNFRSLMGINMNLPGTTVSRVRLDVAAANVGNFQPTYVGLQKVKISDVLNYVAVPAEGLTASPNREYHSDWMLWRVLFPNHGADPTSGLPNAQTYELDVRAMRRLDEAQETLGLVFSKETSVSGYTVQYAISVLLALP